MHLMQPHRVDRRQKRRRIILAVVVLLLVVGCWQAWDRLQPRYLLWKQRRALDQAKEFIAKRDAPNAQVALEVALRTVPGNPETLRVAADLLEQVGAPQAMRLRRAIVQIVPDSAEDAAKLVMSCIAYRDYNAAKDALSTTPPKIAVQPPMLRAALVFAIVTDNAPIADFLFDRLREQFPNDEELRHTHALLRLRHPREEQRLNARRELEELVKRNPALALQVNREFASDALQRHDYAEAKVRQKLILADAGATFTDRLQKANVDLLIEHLPFEPLFAELAPLAAKNEADAAQFAQWLLVQNRAAEADRWIGGLSPALRNAPAIKSALADSVALLGDWDRLARVLEEGAWGPISKETLRLALAAQTVNNPNRPSVRRDTWDMTLDSATGNLTSLRILQRLAAIWKWDDESERTLWAIARTFPDQTWAHQSLFSLYKERKDTKRMRDVILILRDTEGTVPRYQHDWALLTLIAEPTATWNPAKDTMRSLYTENPENPNYATGYAFALAQAGKPADALAVVQKMTDDDRVYPPRAPYLAFVYGVAKKSEELEKAMAIGQSVNYLPEESYLFTRAREELNRKPEKPKPAKPAAEATSAPGKS